MQKPLPRKTKTTYRHYRQNWRNPWWWRSCHCWKDLHNGFLERGTSQMQGTPRTCKISNVIVGGQQYKQIRIHIANLSCSRHLHPNVHWLWSRHQLYQLQLCTKKLNTLEETPKTPDSQQCGRIPQWGRNNQTLDYPLHPNGRDHPQRRILCHQMWKR